MSKTLPLNLFVPLLVTTLTEAPELRPLSAAKFDVWMATCSMKSIPTLLIMLPFDPESRLKPPSTVRLLLLPRLPLITVPPVPRPVVIAIWSSSSWTAPGMSEASSR